MEEEEKKLVIKKNEKTSQKKMYIMFAVIVIAIIVVDQILKLVAINIGETELIPGILKLNILENKKGSYGIGSDSSIMYIITNLVVIAVLFKFLTSQNDFIGKKIKVFISLIIAGGISNIIDRIFRGYVLEIFEVNIKQIPAFNIADICVLIGWISFVAIFAVFTVREMRANKVNKEIKFEDKNQEDKKEEKKDKEK